MLAQEDDLAMSLQFMDVSGSPRSSVEAKLEGLKSSFVENPQYFCNTRRSSGLAGGGGLHCQGGQGEPHFSGPSWSPAGLSHREEGSHIAPTRDPRGRLAPPLTSPMDAGLPSSRQPSGTSSAGRSC